MDSVLLVIFSLSVLGILHTYLIYPLGMILAFPKPRTAVKEFSAGDDLPEIAILVAAYNEEKVIGEKIASIFNTTYPLSRIKVYIGSDASNDGTEKVISDLAARHSGLELIKFSGRVGKISIINHLQSLGDEDILVMTDANVIFRPETLFELVKKFRDDRVGIVAGNIVKVSLSDKGIAFQEKKYLSIENRIKAAESNAFNLIMGAEGGCYAIRNSLFSKVPLKFIVDDFFITMQVLNRQKFVLFNPAALCLEDVPGDTEGEFRRKVRISSGNFQNLFFFRSLLVKFWLPPGFCFWSHKVLRWFTPFFLIAALLSSLLLSFQYQVFLYIFLVQALGMLSPLLTRILPFNNQFLRFVSHFYLMNLALLQGFFRFSRGIQTSVWQPIKRDV